jgi:hypothetical protein
MRAATKNRVLGYLYAAAENLHDAEKHLGDIILRDVGCDENLITSHIMVLNAVENIKAALEESW